MTPSVVAALLYGKKVGDRHRPPTKRIRPETAAALLAVEFSPNDGAYVDSSEMWRQVEEMVAAGIPRTRIAERVDVGVRNLYPKGGKVTAARARTVAEMYAEFTAGTLVTVRRHRHGDRTLTFDPVEVDLAALPWQSRAGWTPFARTPGFGRVRRVVLRGRTVVEEGRVLAAPGEGRLLRPGA